MSNRYGKRWQYSDSRPIPTIAELTNLNTESKELIASKLSSFGFDITDISESSPFDLLAKHPHFSVAVDVRHRWSKSRISIHRHQIIARMEYDIEVDDKIMVFSTPNFADSYISLSTLLGTSESSGYGVYLLGEYYIIERHSTVSLSMLRKILEVSHLL